MAVGQAHFESRQLVPAIGAFGRVVRRADSPFRLHAAYLLGWSYYRNDEYAAAIDAFDIVAQAPTELRAEAIQYIAISLTEQWESGELSGATHALNRAIELYKDRRDDHVLDIFIALGDVLVEMADTAAAADVYRYAIDRWPYDPRRPKLDAKLAALARTP